MSPPADIPDGSVIITPTEIYKEVRETRDEVKRLATIIDPALAEIRHDVAENKAEAQKLHADHETRLRGLERWRWMAAGVALACGGVAGTVVDLLAR